MANDNWYGKSFETIQKQLSALANNNAQALLTDWYSVSQIVHQSLEDAKKAHDKLNDTNFWDGAGPRAAQASMRTNILDQITDDGLQNKTYKMSEALANDGGTLNASSGVPGRHKLPKDATTPNAKKPPTNSPRMPSAPTARRWTSPVPRLTTLLRITPAPALSRSRVEAGAAVAAAAETPLAVAPTASRNPQAAAPTAWQTRTPSHNSPMETDRAGKGKGPALDPGAVLAEAKAPAQVRVRAVIHRSAPDLERAQAVPVSHWGRPLRQVTVHPDRLAAPASPRARPGVQARCAPAEDFRAGPPAAQVPTQLPSARPACAGEPWDLWA